MVHTDRQSLTKEERMEFYSFLDGVLGPARGVEESVGSYKAYMAEQSRLYFERLLPGSQYHMPKIHAQHRSQTTSQDQDSTPSDSVNFRKWLVSDHVEDISLVAQQNLHRHYYPDGSADSVISNPLPENSMRISSGSFTRTGNVTPAYHSESGFESTLDDLFPDWQGSTFLDDTIGSPVLRASMSDCSEDREDHVTNQKEATILPTLHLDSPQETSPDIASSPFVQTPDTTHQQFIQQKHHFNGHSPNVAHHTAAAFPDGHDIQHPVRLDPQLFFRYGIGPDSAEFKGTSTRFGTSSLPKSREPSSTETATMTARLSGKANRLRTTSAGGGI